MVLNNRTQLFSFYFPSNYLYPEIAEKYKVYLNRMHLPFESCEDFLNSCIQSVNFPSINIPNAIQQHRQYEIEYTTGKEMDAIIEKNLTITFKLTDSYLSYWIIRDQIEAYLKYGEVKKVFWNPLYLTFLSSGGYEINTLEFSQITPTSLSELDLSYKSEIAQYNTFNLGLHYNFQKIVK